MKRTILISILLLLLLAVMFVLDLTFGSIRISLAELFSDAESINRRIMLDLRLPRAITAVLAGVALSVSGLMMQTLFRNPLAGPYILGVSSGATFGVGLLVLVGTLFGFAATNLMTVVAAIIGATFCLLLVLAISYRVKSNVSLLIIGMMIGSIAGALVNLMQNFANPDALKLFIVWSLGSLSSVTWHEMPYLLPIFLIGFIVALLLIKPLNGLLLGENYARGLGINVNRVRLLIVLATGLLAGGITAFCGPIAFVGVAVPHIARGLFSTSNHRLIMPASALIGADLLLVCDLLANQFTYPLPISTLSALFGAPIIIWIILKKK
ncbi:MAG: iron ABC transporter permease [Paludibacteraceae bacterium]|nr:iron ABC transporter permease [Paludibacteraceae bacterium]